MERVPAWLRDGWLPAALLVVAVLEVGHGYADHPAGPEALLSALVPLSLVTGFRRRSPVAAALAGSVLTAVLVLGVLGDVAEQPPLTAFLVLLVLLFSLGAHGEGRGFLLGALGVGACLGGLQLAGVAAGQPPGDVVPSVLFLGTSFAVGRAVHRSQQQAGRERDRARLAEQDRAGHAAEAVAEERARIARELHDVVAHALTGIVVQAGVEARLQPDGSSLTTLRSIEQRGREAMTELRRLLGLLREQGQGPADAPLPSLTAVEGLVGHLERTGHTVRVEHVGTLEGLAPALDLAGYRVLQEALTNVARHAPGATVSVRLERRPGVLRVRVENGPHVGDAGVLSPGGHGVLGMRERVRVYGGDLCAGPAPGGGFAVEATLPLAETAGEPA